MAWRVNYMTGLSAQPGSPDYAEFIIEPAEGRPRWLHPGYNPCDVCAELSGQRERRKLSAFDHSPVKPTPPKAKQSPRHEDDHRNKDDSHRNEIVLGKKAREGLAQQQEKTGADNGPHQRAD